MATTVADEMFTTMADKPSNEQLFEDVVDNCTGLISRIALSFEADIALRRELIQDILLAVWIALPNFRGDSSLKTFVASIAQKRSISHVTRRTREPRQVELSVEMPSSIPPPDEIAMSNDIKKQLVESIQRLPIPQREAIVLSLEGFSHGEIADVLGISVNAAMLRCTRARSALKAMMDRLA
jgi:RNA polymerase sigma-70 factor (ECF subfamily)